MNQGPAYFCKAFVSIWPICDAITSNLAKTFNGYICKARTMPIINMVKEIRTCLMERMYQKNEMMKRCEDVICPKARQKLEKTKYGSRFCVVKPTRSNKFQVAVNEDRFVKSLYFEVDKHSLEPLNGLKMWPKDIAAPLLPPPYKKMPTRPKKNRKKAFDEEPKQPSVTKRFGMQMTCQHCLGIGHNKKACPKIDHLAAPRPATMPGEKRIRYVYESQGIAVAARGIQLNQMPHSQSFSISQPSVIYKSTVSQATAPRPVMNEKDKSKSKNKRK
ncbi:hypothetical protein DITRI_Ditri10aG0066900 [Diplodiscus trichospermus]